MDYYDDTIQAVARITYGGKKAKRFFSEWTPASEKVLREDLVSLGVPNPSKHNIELLKPGCVEFYWDTSWQNDILLRNLDKRIRPHRHSDIAAVQAETKKRLSIVGLRYDITSANTQPTKRDRSPSSDEYEDSEEEESSDYSRPYTQHSSALYAYESPPRPSTPTPPVHPNKKQKLHHPPVSPTPTSQSLDKQVALKPLSNGSSQPVASTSAPPAVLHPNLLVPLSSANADISKVTPIPAKSQAISAQKSQQTVSLPRPSTPTTAPTAQPISDLPIPDSETSLQVESSTQRPPTAPIIPPPPPFSPLLSSASAPSTSTLPLPAAPQSSGTPPMPQRPENITSLMPPKRASQVTRPGIAPLRIAHHIESLRKDEMLSCTSPGTYISSAQATPLSATHVPPEVDIEALMNDEPVRSGITELSRVEKIQKGLAFLQARSQAMVSELQRLGVETPNPERDRVAILEEEVEKLRVALEDERKLVEDERRLIEDERRLVKDERRRREEAENALADVRRELREPFVVPALLDTFLAVSKLTTRVIRKKDE